MMRISILMAGVILCVNGFVAHPVFAGPVIQAISNLNGSFPPPNTRNINTGLLPSSSVEARAIDNLTYTDPDQGYTLTAHNICRTMMGRFKIYQYLMARGADGVGMVGYLIGAFGEKITILPESRKFSVQLAVRSAISGGASGNGTYDGGLNLTITITNQGSAKNPKDDVYKVTVKRTWGKSGTSSITGGPSAIWVETGDVVLLSAVELVNNNVRSNGDLADVEADFLNTTDFYINVLTSGASLRTESGHNYSEANSVSANTWALYE